ncbi:phospho-N-acetylmuramoyl-pentapeptide-transferase [Parachlamydia acanthamoebae]|uniref:Phospho-N-acetylmuramoyl-pentapeptide-transferase n=1 Tax=Parachlamydia acanthamoebae (strain UV7) TaxID=765952 RepID=F8KYA1_PARAV|nr:phospho-N-acetylmuramoyl-pentapeptide-transferase [Parachlamydia acanthamoebae]CCB85836.1 phospho-N-acetylmuramoyl-pentapeptide-transferase [Parachlamydia acanthamoebae UV-7]
MLLFTIDFFREFLGIKIPMVFTYTSTRMILAAITSLIICIFLGPRFIKKLYELKIGQSIRTDECPHLGVLHQKKKDTPTMGGLLILFSMIVSLLLWMKLTHIFTLILIITTLLLGFLGGWDDYLKLKYKNSKGLSSKKKFLYQVLISALLPLYLLSPTLNAATPFKRWFDPPIVKEQTVSKNAQEEKLIAQVSLKEYATRFYIPFFKDPVLTFSGFMTILAALFMIFVVTGASNAVNLTDGLDGLAAGCLIMVAGCLALIAFVSNNIDLASYLNILYIEGSGEIAIYLSALAGACLGFLWYNSYPAQVFMGDTGSLALGGILGVCAILLKKEMLLGIIGGIFVAETLSVILQVGSFKLRNKKRIFLCTPLHHHFEFKGWPETKVVIRFWIVGLLLAIVGIASLKFQ